MLESREAAYAASLPDAGETGRIYTPPHIAAFMARLALGAAARAEDAGPPLVLDPACGCGALLVAMLMELAAAGCDPTALVERHLVGVDTDPAAVAIARQRLCDGAVALGGRRPASGCLHVADALRLALPGPFDVVIANPPYIRHERLAAGTKAVLQRRWGQWLGRGADLATAFFLLGLDSLRPGGVCVYLSSDSWLDVGYAAGLRARLATETRLAAVYQFDEPTFQTADIHPVVAVARREPPLPEAVTRFVRSTAPPAAHPLRTVLRHQTALAGEGHWAGRNLRSPACLGQVLEQAGDRLVPLARLAELRRGWTSGANEVFFVPVDADLPPEALGPPVVVKAGELVTPRLDTAHLRHRLLTVGGETAREPRVVAWLARAEAAGVPLRPTLRGRSPWYAVTPRPPAPLLVPIGHKRRPVLGWLVGDACAGDNLLEVHPRREADVPLLAASLLGTFTMLAYEALGRANFGQGLLKTQVYELAELPVLNPARVDATGLLAALAPLLDRATRIIYDEVQQADRQAFDAAWLAAAGVALDVATLHDAVCRTVWDRQSRASGSRESRLAYGEWSPRSEAQGGEGS